MAVNEQVGSGLQLGPKASTEGENVLDVVPGWHYTIRPILDHIIKSQLDPFVLTE